MKEKLKGVDYIFIDEVSMLSCIDMYNISAQLARLRDNTEEPFGAVNMIFAGDFAQLPPGSKAAALYSDFRHAKSSSDYSQKAVIGKGIWHQTTTVVILRENMRQNGVGSNDDKLRAALDNMRYKACTPQDIDYLHTLLVESQPNGVKKLLSPDFRNVSVITGINAHRDKINEMGVERFAKDTDQELESFYSIDTWNDSSAKAGDHISSSFQKVLWSLPPDCTEHHAGVLKLCHGMPVLIKVNEATECCVTNGAEGYIVHWNSSVNPSTGKKMLDTVFVELKNPPKAIQLEGLPLNVVPLTRESKTVQCKLIDDSVQSIKREQVKLLPNFAMTDYASQGRTRPHNSVDLSKCRSHQSYYTCLSRSSMHDGTLVLQGLNPNLITGGIQGALRQEFRELELLDYISKLRYQSKLPVKISGHTRNILINEFRKWKSEVPRVVHKAIKWTKADDMLQCVDIEDSEWRIVEKKAAKKDKNVLPVGHTSVTQYIVGKTSSLLSSPAKAHLPTPPSTQVAATMRGLKWNSVDYSCAYDSFFTVMWNIWRDRRRLLTSVPDTQNEYLNKLYEGFALEHESSISIEDARDVVRNMLYNQSRRNFPMGSRGANIHDLLRIMLKCQDSIGQELVSCPSCKRIRSSDPIDSLLVDCIEVHQANAQRLMDKWITHESRYSCTACKIKLHMGRHFQSIPKLFVISVPDEITFTVTKTISMSFADGVIKHYSLSGLIYYGQAHFVSRFIDKFNNVWFHDGMLNGGQSQLEREISSYTEEHLGTCGNKELAAVIYIAM